MNNAFIAGYYGMKNTGDDALQLATCWGVDHFFNIDKIYVTGSSKIQNHGVGADIHYLPLQRFKGENKIKSFFRAIKSDVIIFGGGSVFHSTDSMIEDIFYINACRTGLHAALGVAIGPFRDVRAEKTCACLLKQLNFIGVRDTISYNIVKTLAPRVNCERTFDLAPLLKHINPKGFHSENENCGKRTLGLSLCNYETYVGGNLGNEKSRITGIVNLLNKITPDMIDEIVFIDFNGHEKYGDRKIHSEIANRLECKIKIRHVCYTSDPYEVLKTISQLSFLIAMRLHAVVFGYLTQIPTMMLSYHPKCDAWANDVGMHPENIIDGMNLTAEKIIPIIVNGLHGTFKMPTLPVESAVKSALKNWMWINQMS